MTTTSLAWPTAPPTLTDGQVTLRAWEPEDADAVFAACQDAEIQRWTRVPSPYLAEHAAGFVGGFSARQWAARQGASFAVASPGENRVLGSCGLVAVHESDRVAEVGYWIAPWARGQRVAQRAVRLVSGWALAAGGLERLELLIEPANLASCAVAERAGCVREGVLRRKALHRGVRKDMAIYALVK